MKKAFWLVSSLKAAASCLVVWQPSTGSYRPGMRGEALGLGGLPKDFCKGQGVLQHCLLQEAYQLRTSSLRHPKPQTPEPQTPRPRGPKPRSQHGPVLQLFLHRQLRHRLLRRRLLLTREGLWLRAQGWVLRKTWGLISSFFEENI